MKREWEILFEDDIIRIEKDKLFNDYRVSFFNDCHYVGHVIYDTYEREICYAD